MAMREVEDAAERVMRAMRALDAHRHQEAPTLEREYRRALEAYFQATQATMATMARDADADDEDDEVAVEDLRRARASVDAHYAAARQALRLARIYRREPATTGRRERECFEAVQRHRDAIRALRLRLRPQAEQLALPGLVKARPTPAAERRAAKAS
jgi:hypothetical protein